MDIHLLTSQQDLIGYDHWVKTHPHGTLWQSLEWKTYQEAAGREVRIYAAVEHDAIVASALVVIDRTAFGYSTWDIPRGPLGPREEPRYKTQDTNKHQNTISNALMQKIINDARKDKCLSLYLSPIQKLESSKARKLKTSNRHEQPEATRILDLTLTEEDLLAQMHQKGRYNIKVAQKNGVIVKQSNDCEAYAHLAKQTAIRDHYKAAPTSQYQAFLEHLPGSFLLLAYPHSAEQKKDSPAPPPIAGLLGVTWGTTGIYYYGASDYEHRALMAPYLLQWEAMKLCREAGCTSYDLLGVAPPDSGEDHPWRGISGFKEKFGGSLIVYPSEKRVVLRRTANMMLKMKRKLFG